MLIIFQSRIIYMPNMPPFSRSEKVADYASECKPVTWEDHPIESMDGTRLRLLEGSIAEQSDDARRDRVVIIYFQGNGSSLPPRLPYLSRILKQLRAQSTAKYTLLALSYRGFWTSRGRASQKGIELDAQATLDWVTKRYGADELTRFVLYGQSIGAGVATTAAATWLSRNQQGGSGNQIHISGVLLETPFTSLREMLVSIYPQKFLPYRYLGPFLKSTWDSQAALRSIDELLDLAAQHQKLPSKANVDMRVLLLEAGNDELVPQGNAALLFETCRNSQHIQAEHRVVRGALHTNVMTKADGKKEIVRFLKEFESKT